MILTSKYAHAEVHAREAAVLRVLLGVYPHGRVSFLRIVGSLGTWGLSDLYVSHLLSRLREYGLVENFVDDNYYRVNYCLTTDGWLKAVALEQCPCSSKDRMQACGA